MSARFFFLSRPISFDEQKPMLAIHHSSIFIKDGDHKAYIVTNGRAKEVKVNTGQRMGEMVEVLNGLKIGDRVVINPSSRLRDGQRVRFE